MLTPIPVAKTDVNVRRAALVVRICHGRLEWVVNKLIPILAIVLLAGCGEMRWSRPDGDSSAARDEANCRAAASESVSRQYGPPIPTTSRYSDPRFGADPSIPSQADRAVLESQAVDRCMRARGYALVPAGK